MQTLLSEHWHAVRYLRPRLREGVQALHRRLRGKPWVLLFDPVTQRFHRMSPSVYRVISLLDGQRTLDEVWTAACEQAGDAAADQGTAISQHELVQLMSSLYTNDLLQTQVSPDASEVFERFQKQARSKMKQSWLNPLSIKLPLLYPDPWFERHAALARALFSWGVLAAWLALVLPAGVLAAQHWTGLTENLSDRVLSATNLLLLWVTYPVVKSIHEWAHGMAVKAWGGRVREIGLMLIVFMPVPYVDATASYHFPSKWARAAVAAAGIMAELALGAIAVYVWLMAESGLVTAFAFNVILIAGVSTLLVNGNPLMRYDGYFIFCDIFELPNLAQRATQYWTYLIDRFAFGSPDAQPPLESSGERWLLGAYGAVAPFYRMSISIGLIWFIATQYFFVGVLLAIAGAWTAAVMPIWKGWKHLTEGAALARRRESAMRRTLITGALVAAVVGFLPLPFYSTHQAVVWLPDDAIVRAQSAAHIAQARVNSAELVTAGQTLLSLDSPTLLADYGVALASVMQVQAQLRQAEVDNQVRAESLRAQLASRSAKLEDLQHRVDALSVVAATAGRWTPAAPTDLAGRYVKRGDVLGYIVTGPSRLVRVAVTQEDMDVIRSRVKGVDVRLANAVRSPIAGQVQRQVPGGEFDLVSPALGTNGGGDIAVDPSQQKGTRALKRVFDVEVLLAQPSSAAVFGDRAYVRFDLGWTPLGVQWFLRLRQLFLAGLNV
ncbi:MAG: site-2 protease family protein [Rhizobacter sp.]